MRRKKERSKQGQTSKQGKAHMYRVWCRDMGTPSGCNDRNISAQNAQKSICQHTVATHDITYIYMYACIHDCTYIYIYIYI